MGHGYVLYMTNNRKFLIITSMSILLLTVCSLCVLLYGIDLSSPTLALIIRRIRLNQLIAAISVGGGLAVAGILLQTYFNNNLASPHTLGVISLSGVGAAVSIVFGLSSIYQFGFAFSGALVFFLLLSFSNLKTSNVIFIGVFLNFVGDSLIMWIKYLFAKIEDYASIDYWFWGSLEKVTTNSLLWLVVLIVTSAIILKYSNFLDLISQGIEHQKSVSFDLKLYKRNERGIIIFTSIIVAIAAITTGKIGFIGLMAPHIAKKIGNGLNHFRLLMISFLIGSNILTLSLILQIYLKKNGVGKLPIGLILSIPGIITFFYILKGRKHD